jgi:hypothetical protein
MLPGMSTQWNLLVDELKNAGITFEVGLTDKEILAIESEFHFVFPQDLRAFLQTAVPVGPQFANWRNEDKTSIQQMLDWPLEGLLFDIENNNLWQESWGAKPSDIQKAKEVLKELIKKAPTLIPIFSHRMMPDLPHTAGNPVFSIYQSDIIYYGSHLEDYLRREFLHHSVSSSEAPRPIEFWGTLVS